MTTATLLPGPGSQHRQLRFKPMPRHWHCANHNQARLAWYQFKRDRIERARQLGLPEPQFPITVFRD